MEYVRTKSHEIIHLQRSLKYQNSNFLVAVFRVFMHKFSIILLTFTLTLTGDLSLKDETKIHQIINGVFAASPVLTLLISV